jgi:putative transcriptional regulator
MNKFSKELIESLTEACEHAEGKPSGVRVHVVEVPDVRAIRRQLRMSQQEFARVYRIPLATLKNWEQGRRQPDAPAAAYLQLIAERPREVGKVEAEKPIPSRTVAVTPEFWPRLQQYVINAGIDMSVLRGAPAGTKEAAHKFLIELDLKEFTKPASFSALLDDKTEALRRTFPKNAQYWGRARKCLNIFLRNATYSYYLRERYGLGDLEPSLELPLDSNVARGLTLDAANHHLCAPPKWDAIIRLTPTANRSYQSLASIVAQRKNIHRVHLDLWYWREEVAAKRAMAQLHSHIAIGTKL